MWTVPSINASTRVPSAVKRTNLQLTCGFAKKLILGIASVSSRHGELRNQPAPFEIPELHGLCEYFFGSRRVRLGRLDYAICYNGLFIRRDFRRFCVARQIKSLQMLLGRSLLSVQRGTDKKQMRKKYCCCDSSMEFHRIC
jgi:hypothetical protein